MFGRVCPAIGLTSSTSLLPPLRRAIKDKVSSCYHLNSRVVEVSLAAPPGAGVSLQLESGARHAGDLLVGADGPGSIVRSTFFPGARSEYQGYVAWRGLLAEDAAPAAAVALLGGRKFTVHVGRGFHILCYLVPGRCGEAAPGRRRINWVWYWNHSQEELDGMAVDAHGKRHGHGVPRGALRQASYGVCQSARLSRIPNYWRGLAARHLTMLLDFRRRPDLAEERKRVAREVLPPVLAELVEATDKVFFQAIHDLLAPSLVAQGRVALVGDAGVILRPHTAAGTTKAAVNASVLARCLRASGADIGAALKEYNAEMLELGRHLVEVGSAIGQQSQDPGLE